MDKNTNTSSQFSLLTLAGMEQPGSDHWIRRWEERRDDVSRVELGIWDKPHRNSWVTSIAQAVARSDKPVILIARGLACHAVAWWAALERPTYGYPVAGAMLVAPPNVDVATDDLRLVGFGPAPKALLPFPSVVVASRNDPRMDFAGARALARLWGSQCVDGGEIGSASAAADLGDWGHGEHVLNWLVEAAADHSLFTQPAPEPDNVVRFLPQHSASFAGDISL